MIMINQVIGVFNDDGIEDLMSKSQHCDCTFIYRNDADTELFHKLQTIYKKESSRLRNDFKAIHGFLFQSSLQFVFSKPGNFIGRNRKSFHTLDLGGLADFIILARHKQYRILPPLWRSSEKFSDLWSPTTKLEDSPIMLNRFRIPDNMEFRNGLNFCS